MASPTGFEPVTPRLGISCSIRLSYGDLRSLLAKGRLSGHRKVVRSRIWRLFDVHQAERGGEYPDLIAPCSGSGRSLFEVARKALLPVRHPTDCQDA